MKLHTQDLYTPLAHIPDLADDGTLQRPPGVPTWVDPIDGRRLTTYRVTAAYRENTRRYYLPPQMWQQAAGVDPTTGLLRSAGTPAAELYREYGHGGLLVDTARALVLGADQTIVLPALTDTDQPDPRVAAAGDWLQGWATVERLTGAFLQGEEHTVGDGDGVYVLAWSNARQRPRLRVYDPGFYFPDLLARDTTPGWEDEYPPVVHLAWEYEDPLSGETILRRHTWRLTPLDPPAAAPWGGRREWTCLASLTDFRISRLKGDVSIYGLTGREPAARVITPERDLEIDYIPLVHVPNDEAGERHFGRGIFMRASQVLDDINASDTDNALTSELVGSPATVTTGAGPNPGLTAGPGARWGLPDGATAALMDTSRALDAGIKHNSALLDTLAVNSRLGQTLLGRVKPNEVPSGYAMDLGFAPASQLLREMRQVREAKYALLLKFALRMAQAYKVLDAGETPTALIEFGASLPSDRGTAVTEVATLLPAGAISTETAVRVLQAAGLPIDDAEDEVTRIREQQIEEAVQLVDATGDVNAARSRLGLPDAAPVVPAPEPPA